MLVDLTGWDWCGWCKRSEAEVFDKDAFKSEDPSLHPGRVGLSAQEEALRRAPAAEQGVSSEHYKIEGFPTILMMDAGGQGIAEPNYRAGRPEEYVKHLADFTAIYENVVKMKRGLGKAQELARAKLLDQLVHAWISSSTTSPTTWRHGARKSWPWTGQQGGAESKHQFRLLMVELRQVQETRKWEEAKAAVEKALLCPASAASRARRLHEPG